MNTHAVVPLHPSLTRYLDLRARELATIPPARHAALDEITGWVRAEHAGGGVPRLLFVCTHNSRRSHMAQLWFAAAAARHGVAAGAYSAGTEVTAFNARAVAAMERAGFRIEQTTGGENPVYHATIGAGTPPIPCFSKRIADESNPESGFAAVMVCGEADEACPTVPGAAARFALAYEDPKAGDGTEREADLYDERCRQIAREMLCITRGITGADGDRA